MANILVIGEHAEGKVKKVTFELVTKASELAAKLGGQAEVVFIGSGISNTAEVGQYGAKKAYVLNNANLEKYNTDAYTKVLFDLVNELKPQVVLGTASPVGKDVLPRLAARLDSGLASDCTNLDIQDGKLVATRPVYSGKAIIDVKFESALQVASARPNSFVPSVVAAGAAAEVVNKDMDAGTLRAVLKELVKAQSQKADLTEAGIIVSGGRAMKAAENFKILAELADVIGATVGASRAAVDSGYATHDMQVGQTGKVVNPNLYIACGISGAIQHLAGMRTSKVIVAINKDPEAPIFTKADYGIVGDLFQIVPLLTQEFKKALQG
ncbi:MAG: electron transfer flavoprotein subunit alpha/FixB family protein [Deltaproteobacteria bacterium]|nr:MAG: electron transfer flavoprotein subunit alpha/FixB family protein [Deltaproteobacteria bacterium]